MAHIAHQPDPVCVEGGVSRWLAGVVGLGAELQRPHAARGALLQIFRSPLLFEDIIDSSSSSSSSSGKLRDLSL
jgi:hypothetical protein